MTYQSLPAAKAHLDKAITQLFDPIYTTINGRQHEANSLYTQLVDAKAGQTGERCGGTAGMPLWPDAADLQIRIDTQLHEWNQGRGFNTSDRVYLLEVRAWKIEDVDLIETIATRMDEWANAIDNLLNPKPHWSVPAACPQCNYRWVYRHSAGEQVRQPALQITTDGCQCQNHQCKASWGPEKFQFLANLLGFEKPEGILE